MHFILIVGGIIAYLFFLRYALNVKREIKAMKRETRSIIKETRRDYKKSVKALKKCHAVTVRRVKKYTEIRRRILNSSIKKFVNQYKKVKNIKLISVVDEEYLGDLDDIQDVEVAKSLKEAKVVRLSDRISKCVDAFFLIMIVEIVGSMIFSFFTFFLFIFRAKRRAQRRLADAKELHANTSLQMEYNLDSILAYDAIREYTDILEDLLYRLSALFKERYRLFHRMIRKREGMIFKKKLTQNDFTYEDIELISTTRALAGAIKAIIDTRITDDAGTLSYAAEVVKEQSEEVYSTLVG